MILELDCGNTLIKWRMLREEDGSVRKMSLARDADDVLSGLNEYRNEKVSFCRMVSVRSNQETLQLIVRLQGLFHVEVRLATAERSRGPVVNAYGDYQRLGLDRWLVILAAHHLAGEAALVIDVGTAVTVDYVAADGRHLGGFICPGVPLMRNQLRNHTRKISYTDQSIDYALRQLDPGGSTAEAVERGCLLMVRSFVQAQCETAGMYLGDSFQVFITGGDADLMGLDAPNVRWMPDLVFVGLAIACPVA